MRYKIIFSAAVLTAAIAASSCGSALYEPVPSDAHGNTTYEKLIKGRTIFADKCGRCHNLYIPEKHTSDEWKVWLDRMQNRAGISDAERDMIYGYLILKAKPSDVKRDKQTEKN